MVCCLTAITACFLSHVQILGHIQAACKSYSALVPRLSSPQCMRTKTTIPVLGYIQYIILNSRAHSSGPPPLTFNTVQCIVFTNYYIGQDEWTTGIAPNISIGSHVCAAHSTVVSSWWYVGNVLSLQGMPQTEVKDNSQVLLLWMYCLPLRYLWCSLYKSYHLKSTFQHLNYCAGGTTSGETVTGIGCTLLNWHGA